MKLMSSNPILLVAGEPNSIFLEIFFKTLKKKKFKSPIILICSKKILESQMKHFNFEYPEEFEKVFRGNTPEINDAIVESIAEAFQFQKEQADMFSINNK